MQPGWTNSPGDTGSGSAGSYRIRVFAFSATGAPISKLFVIRVRA